MADCSCPDINDKKFENKFFNWKGKVFYTKKQPLIFHVPVKMDERIKKLIMDVESSDYKVNGPEIVLQQDAAFRGNIMVEIEDPKVEGRNILRFNDYTKVYSKLFKEPWNKLARGVRDVVKELHKKKMNVHNVYFMYLTCPVCAKEKGYKTVIFCEVSKKSIEKIYRENQKEAKKKAKAMEKEKKRNQKKAAKKPKKQMIEKPMKKKDKPSRKNIAIKKKKPKRKQ